MSQSEISIKIGCQGSEQEERYSSFSLNMTFQQSRINEYNKNIQKQLNAKRTPLMVLQLNSNQEFSLNEQISIGNNQFDVKIKNNGSKYYIYGDIKNQQKLLFIKKLQRIFHLMTQLNLFMHINCSLYQVSQKIKQQKLTLARLLNKIKIRGKLKLDQKTLQTLKKCITKISPKFVQSPIFLFLEVLVGFNFRLDLQNLDLLQDQSQNRLLSKVFNVSMHNKQLCDTIQKSKSKLVKLTLCLQKLFLLQITGSSQQMALLLLFL